MKPKKIKESKKAKREGTKNPKRKETAKREEKEAKQRGRKGKGRTKIKKDEFDSKKAPGKNPKVPCMDKPAKEGRPETKPRNEAARKGTANPRTKIQKRPAWTCRRKERQEAPEKGAKAEQKRQTKAAKGYAL